MPDTSLPSLPQSSMVDPATGQVREEWRRYLAALDKIIRRLNV
jgi:hypothetical protein